MWETDHLDHLIVMLVPLTAPVLVQHCAGGPSKLPLLAPPAALPLPRRGIFDRGGDAPDVYVGAVAAEPVWRPVARTARRRGLLAPRTRRISAWAAIAMLVVFFPANVYAAVVHAPVGGHALGPAYLLVRAPVQLFMIGWIYAMIARPGQPRPR